MTKCFKGREMWQKLPITNPYNELIEVEIMSSKPELVTPIKKRLSLGPKETAHAVLYFYPFGQRAKKEVFIFVNETMKEKSKFNHAYLLEISYEQP